MAKTGVLVQNVLRRHPRASRSRDDVYLIPHKPSRDGRFGSKVAQIGPKWDKSGAFSDQISVHLAHRATLEPNLPSLS